MGKTSVNPVAHLLVRLPRLPLPPPGGACFSFSSKRGVAEASETSGESSPVSSEQDTDDCIAADASGSCDSSPDYSDEDMSDLKEHETSAPLDGDRSESGEDTDDPELTAKEMADMTVGPVCASPCALL